MKPALLILILSLCSVSAQNFIVRWTGANTNRTPEYWPIIVRSCGTNTVVGSEIVLSGAQLDEVIRTNTVAFVSGQQAQIANVLSNKLLHATTTLSNVVWGADYIAANWGTTTLAQKQAQLNQLRTAIDKLVPVYEQMMQLLNSSQ